MRLIFVLCGVILAHGAGTRGECPGVWVRGQYYAKETLVAAPELVTYLATAYGSNDLYYNYWAHDPAGTRHRILAKLNLDTKHSTLFPRVRDAYAYAINYEADEIYYGIVDGIVKYEVRKDQVTYYKIEGTLMWGLYYKDALYFKSYGAGRWYVFNDTKYTEFEDLRGVLAWTFVIDGDDLYYSNYTGLYRQKLGTKDAVLIHNQSTAPMMNKIANLVLDPSGQLFASLEDSEDGVYVLDKQSMQLKSLQFRHAKYITFDKDGHIIYANDWNGGVYRAMPSNEPEHDICID